MFLCSTLLLDLNFPRTKSGPFPTRGRLLKSKEPALPTCNLSVFPLPQPAGLCPDSCPFKDWEIILPPVRWPSFLMCLEAVTRQRAQDLCLF